MSANASTPSAYNLLELYRQHRDEVDVLTDQTSLFILAFANEMKSVDIDDLAGDLHLSLTALRAKLTPLLRGQMMLDSKGILTVTALGRRVLIELGFIPPLPPGPAEPPKKPEPPTQPPRQRLVRREAPPPTKSTSVVIKSTVTPGWGWGIIAFLLTGLILLGSLIVAIIVWPRSTPAPPRIAPQAFFGADSTHLQSGSCTFLRWSVQGGDWVELDGRRVSFSDSTQVCPTQTTVYSLVVGSDIGINRDVQIIVETPTQPPPIQVQISFDADRTSINQGECTLLRWNVQGGYSVQLDDQKVDHTGQQQVCPPQTTTYQLAVDTGNQLNRNQVSIYVDVPRPAPPPTAIPSPIPTQGPQVLFFDDFSTPNTASLYQANLPNAPFKYGMTDAIYQGAPSFTYQPIDGRPAIRLKNLLANTQRRGWSTQQAFSVPEGRMMRLEARFDTLLQSPETGIDQLLEVWLLDARGPTVCSNQLTALITCWRYDKAALLGMDYGKTRRFSADTRFGQAGGETAFPFADNTWYRMVITGSSTRSVRASIFSDDGTTELIGMDFGHALNSYPTGFKIGLSQSMGLPNGTYSTDVAIDWIQLTAEP